MGTKSIGDPSRSKHAALIQDNMRKLTKFVFTVELTAVKPTEINFFGMRRIGFHLDLKTLIFNSAEKMSQ